MSTNFKDILLVEYTERRKKERRGKKSLSDRYIYKAVELMISNIEKEKNNLPDDKRMKVFENLLTHFINDLKYQKSKLKEN